MARPRAAVLASLPWVWEVAADRAQQSTLCSQADRTVDSADGWIADRAKFDDAVARAGPQDASTITHAYWVD